MKRSNGCVLKAKKEEEDNKAMGEKISEFERKLKEKNQEIQAANEKSDKMNKIKRTQ